MIMIAESGPISRLLELSLLECTSSLHIYIYVYILPRGLLGRETHLEKHLRVTPFRFDLRKCNEPNTSMTVQLGKEVRRIRFTSIAERPLISQLSRDFSESLAWKSCERYNGVGLYSSFSRSHYFRELLTPKSYRRRQRCRRPPVNGSAQVGLSDEKIKMLEHFVGEVRYNVSPGLISRHRRCAPRDGKGELKAADSNFEAASANFTPRADVAAALSRPRIQRFSLPSLTHCRSGIMSRR